MPVYNSTKEFTFLIYAAALPVVERPRINIGTQEVISCLATAHDLITILPWCGIYHPHLNQPRGYPSLTSAMMTPHFVSQAWTSTATASRFSPQIEA